MDPMPNRLAHETSPYLLQHADNPVDWWPWSAEAFEEARKTNKPVLLSVGYSSCHWCHVMAHDPFGTGPPPKSLTSNLVTTKSAARSPPTSTPSTWRPC